MNDYNQIISKMTSAPWLIMEDSLHQLVEVVNHHLKHGKLSEDELRTRMQDSNGRTRTRAEVGSGIGVVPIAGPIFPKANMMTEFSGATSIESFRNDFRMLMGDDRVGSIVLDIDSPGGSSDLIEEMGAEIRESRDEKPIYAISNTLAASGAYWLASQATKVYSTPSGSVGSIGAYALHEDRSSKDASDGIKVTVIKAGDYKAELSPHSPLSQEAFDYQQGLINDLYNKFVDNVAEGRDVSTELVKSESWGKGRVVPAARALKVGMVDGVMTMDDLLGNLLEASQPVGVSVRNGTRAAALNMDAIRARMEVVEKEHSEPGTVGPGGEPEPRETPVERDAQEGWRRDSPPITKELSVNREQLVALASSLGVKVDSTWTDEQLSSKCQEAAITLAAEVEPLRAAAADVARKKQFAVDYPDEAARMARMETRDQETDAKEFASQFSRFKSESGEPTDRGFSSLVVEKIEKFALDFTRKEAVISDFGEILTKIGENGIVTYGEKGSSRSSEGGSTGSVLADKEDDPKKRFALLVSEIATQDSLDWKAATRAAAQKYPDEFQAYEEAVRAHGTKK